MLDFIMTILLDSIVCHAELVSASRSRNKFGMTVFRQAEFKICHAEFISASIALCVSC